jgi:O-antigen/teichoic acid export membrane protein
MPLSLQRNAAWAFLGEAVFAACHWGGFVVLGRLGGPEVLGRYALALAVVLPMMLFGGMQMRQLQAVDAAQRYAFADYFAVRLSSIVCTGVVILAIALLGYAWQTGVCIILVGLARGFESLSDVHYGLAQRRQRLDLVAQSMMVRGGAGLLALGIGYYLTASLGVGLSGMAAAWALAWWLFDRRATAQWRDAGGAPTAPSLVRRLRLMRTALPLGIALMLSGLNPNIPRYFIEGTVGLAALGVFTAAAHFVIAGRMMINAVCQAASPRLADLYAAGNLVGFRQLSARLLAISLIPGLVGLVIAIVFGRELLTLVYGPKFADGAAIFPWIMAVGVVLYAQTPFGYGLTAMHQFKVQPSIFGLAVAVNAAGCLVLVPRYGLMGAILPWLSAAACELVLSAAAHWRCLRRSVCAKATTSAGAD